MKIFSKIAKAMKFQRKDKIMKGLNTEDVSYIKSENEVELNKKIVQVDLINGNRNY